MAASIVRRFFSVFFGRIGELVIGMAVTPVLVRLLGSSKYGEYAFVLSIVALVFIFVEAGVFDGLRKYIAESRQRDDWQAHVFAFYVRIAVVLSVGMAVLVVAVATSGVVSEVLGEQFTVYAYIIAVMIVSEQLFSVARGTLMGFGLEAWSEPLRVARNVVYGTVAIALAYLGLDVVGVLIGEVVGAFLVAVVGFALIARNVPLRTVLQPSPEYLPRSELLSFNANGIMLNLLIVSLYNLDIVTIQWFVDSSATGYYKAALVVTELLWFAPLAVQMVFLQSASRLWSRGETERLTSLSARGTRYTLLFTLLLATGIAILAEPFVTFYFGPEFVVAVTPLLILLPGTVSFAVARPLTAVAQGSGNLRPLVYATGAAALLNLVLNIAFVPRYGIIGAAVATSVGYGTMLLFHVYVAWSFGFDPFADLRLGRVVSTAVPSAALIYVTTLLISSDLLALAVVPPFGLAVYVLLALLTGALDRSELDDVLEELPVDSRYT
jgi:O-antigen/teichoic acid export membrane protein